MRSFPDKTPTNNDALRQIAFSWHRFQAKWIKFHSHHRLLVHLPSVCCFKKVFSCFRWNFPHVFFYCLVKKREDIYIPKKAFFCIFCPFWVLFKKMMTYTFQTDRCTKRKWPQRWEIHTMCIYLQCDSCPCVGSER